MKDIILASQFNFKKNDKILFWTSGYMIIAGCPGTTTR